MKNKNRLVALLAAVLLSSCSFKYEPSSSSKTNSNESTSSSSQDSSSTSSNDPSASSSDSSSKDDKGYKDPSLINGYSLEKLTFSNDGTLTVNRLVEILVEVFNNKSISIEGMSNIAIDYYNGILKKGGFKEDQITKIATFVKENLGLFEKIYDKETKKLGDTKIIYDSIAKVLEILDEKQIAILSPTLLNSISIFETSNSLNYGYNIYTKSQMEEILSSLSGDPKEYYEKVKEEAERRYSTNIYSYVPEYCEEAQIKLGQVIYHLFKTIESKGEKYLDELIKITMGLNQVTQESTIATSNIVTLANIYGDLIENEFMDRDSFIDFVNVYADSYLSSLESNLKQKAKNQAGTILTINKKLATEYSTYLKANSNKLFDGIKLLGRYLKTIDENSVENIVRIFSLLSSEDKSGLEETIVKVIKAIDTTANSFGEDCPKVKEGLASIISIIFALGTMTTTGKLYTTGNYYSSIMPNFEYSQIENLVSELFGFASYDPASLSQAKKDKINKKFSEFSEFFATYKGSEYTYSLNWDSGKFNPNDKLEFVVSKATPYEQGSEAISATITKFEGFDTSIEKGITIASSTYDDLEIYFTYYVSSFEIKNGIFIHEYYDGKQTNFVPIGTSLSSLSFTYDDSETYQEIKINNNDVYCLDTSKEGKTYFAVKIGNDYYWSTLYVYDKNKIETEIELIYPYSIMQGETYGQEVQYELLKKDMYEFNGQKVTIYCNLIIAGVEALDTTTPGKKIGRTTKAYDEETKEYLNEVLEFYYYVYEVVDKSYAIRLDYEESGLRNVLFDRSPSGIMLDEEFRLVVSIKYKDKNGDIESYRKSYHGDCEFDEAEIARVFYDSIPDAYDCFSQDDMQRHTFVTNETVNVKINGKAEKAYLVFDGNISKKEPLKIETYEFENLSINDDGNFVLSSYTDQLVFRIDYENGTYCRTTFKVPEDMDLTPSEGELRTYDFTNKFIGIVIKNALGISDDESVTISYYVE